MNKKEVTETLMKLRMLGKENNLDKAAALADRAIVFAGYLDRIKSAKLPEDRRVAILFTLKHLQASVNLDRTIEPQEKLKIIFNALKRTAEITIPALEKTYEEEQAKAKKD